MGQETIQGQNYEATPKSGARTQKSAANPWPHSLTPSPTPLRRIIRSSSARPKRAVRSLKAGGMIECESNHEAHFAILAELDPNVTSIFSQPFQWSDWFDGRKRHHWPDFAVVIADQPEIHEVKECAKLDDDMEWQTRCDWAAWSAKQGVPYSLTLDIHLHAPVQRRCIEDLWFEHARKVDPLLTLSIQSLLESGPMSIGSIIEMISPPKPFYDEILALAAQGQIYIDTANAFSLATSVRFPDPANLPPRLIPFFCPTPGKRP